MVEPSFPRRIAVLGASGSIGHNALDVIAQSDGRLVPILLSVHRQTDLLVQQIRQLREPPRWIIITDQTADRTPLGELPKSIEVFFGHDALCELIRSPEVDIVLSAIVGSAGLTSTWSALESGKIVALANKESLVMGGALLADLSKSRGGKLIPVDSEHSAVMQALCAGWGTAPSAMHSAETHSVSRASNVAKIILTASGGPFRSKTLEDLLHVTIEDALAHPTWTMGKKITIDSATMMNKALEIIEARWFFDVSADKIDVVIHPQSLVHSMVEFVDGSVIAQMSPPDMRLPIQLAFYYPYRFSGPAFRMDWSRMQTLEFYPPDFVRFPALRLGLEVAASGGTSGAVVNAANEVAVSAFLSGNLAFHDIVQVNRTVLEQHHFEPHPTLERLLALDSWARTECGRLLKKSGI